MHKASIGKVRAVSVVVIISVIVFVVFCYCVVGSLLPSPPTASVMATYTGYLDFLKEHTEAEWHTIWDQVWDCSATVKVPASIVAKFSTSQEAADKVLEHIRVYTFWADIPTDAQFSFRKQVNGSLELGGFYYYINADEVISSVDNAIVSALYQVSVSEDILEASADIDRYLRRHVKYSSDGRQEGQTLYSALVDGEAVCAGYASAYNVIALLSGIDSRIVVGYLQTAPDKVIRHAWNVITVDGTEYFTDSTTNATNRVKRIVNVLEAELYEHGYTAPEQYAEELKLHNNDDDND